MFVVTCHMEGAWFGNPRTVPAQLGVTIGPLAVAMLFGISAFVLAEQFRTPGRPVAVKHYLIRRVARLTPGYWVALSLLAVYPGLPKTDLGAYWWRFYGFLQVYWTETFGYGLPQAWTLCVEMTWYLLLPVYIAIVASRRLSPRQEIRLLLGFATLGVVIRGSAGIASPTSLIIALTLPGTLSWFAIGLILSALRGGTYWAIGERLVAVARRPWTCWGAATLIVAIDVALRLPPASFSKSGPVVSVDMALLSLAAILVLAPGVFAREHPAVQFLATSAPVQFAGRTSYGIYLWHFSVVTVLANSSKLHAAPLPFVTYVAVCWVFILPLAAASWWLIERPIMEWTRARLRGRSTAARVSTGTMAITPERPPGT